MSRSKLWFDSYIQVTLATWPIAKAWKFLMSGVVSILLVTCAVFYADFSYLRNLIFAIIVGCRRHKSIRKHSILEGNISFADEMFR